jgi:hypothetical protein
MRRGAVCCLWLVACGGGAPIQAGEYDIHALLTETTCGTPEVLQFASLWQFVDLSDGCELTALTTGVSMTSDDCQVFSLETSETVDSCRVTRKLDIELANEGDGFSGTLTERVEDCHDRVCVYTYDIAGSRH